MERISANLNSQIVGNVFPINFQNNYPGYSKYLLIAHQYTLDFIVISKTGSVILNARNVWNSLQKTIARLDD